VIGEKNLSISKSEAQQSSGVNALIALDIDDFFVRAYYGIGVRGVEGGLFG